MDRSMQQSPEYRPPLAAGQVYPALGYGDDGTPMFTYDDRERVLAGPPPPAPPMPPAPAPAPTPEPEPRWGLAIGLAATVVLVLAVAVGFKMFGGGDDAPVQRADPPATQATDDPYLESLPNQPPPSVPHDPETDDEHGSGGAATVVYEVESGPATILYLADDRMRIARTESGTWKQTVRGSQSTMLTVSVIPTTDAPASCSITVDGKKVVTQSSGDGQVTTMVTCRYRG